MKNAISYSQVSVVSYDSGGSALTLTTSSFSCVPLTDLLMNSGTAIRPTSSTISKNLPTDRPANLLQRYGPYRKSSATTTMSYFYNLRRPNLISMAANHK